MIDLVQIYLRVSKLTINYKDINRPFIKNITILKSQTIFIIYAVNLSYLYTNIQLEFGAFFEALMVSPSMPIYNIYFIGKTMELEIFEIKIRIVDQHFIKRTIITTIEKKLFILLVIQGYLYIKLNTQPIVKISMSYKQFIINITKNKVQLKTVLYLMTSQ